MPEIYTVLEWYTIDDEKVVWALQNRRDNPDPDGPPYFDFAGLSVAWYAGRRPVAGEEDYWDVKGARPHRRGLRRGVPQEGITEPLDRLTPQVLAGVRPGLGPLRRSPAALVARPHDIRPITKPRELRELLGQH